MARLNVSATRSSLLAVRQSLELARQGYQLLDKKRDVLVMEILRLIGDAESVQKQVEERFRVAYGVLQEARAAMGTERVMRFALSRPHELDVHITPRSIMGVVVPSVTLKAPAHGTPYGLGDTSVSLDQAQQAWADVLAQLAELSEKVTTVWRLALELRRTTRRVNALENLFIPSYEETVRYIESTLEEKDREEIYRTKLAKRHLEHRAG